MNRLLVSTLIFSALLGSQSFAETSDAPRAVSALIDVDHVNFAVTQATMALTCPKDVHVYSMCVASIPVAVMIDGDKQELSGNYIYVRSLLKAFNSDEQLKANAFNALSARLNNIKTKCFGQQFKLDINGDQAKFRPQDAQAYAGCIAKKLTGAVSSFEQQGTVYVTGVADAAKQASQQATERLKQGGTDFENQAQQLKARAEKAAGDKFKELGDNLKDKAKQDGDDDKD